MRHRFAMLAAALGLSPAPAFAANTGVTVHVLHDTSPMRGVAISSEGASATTDIRGLAHLSLEPGRTSCVSSARDSSQSACRSI
jgi:hypothetical protein